MYLIIVMLQEKKMEKRRVKSKLTNNLIKLLHFNASKSSLSEPNMMSLLLCSR